jgi:hypothetical protein
MIFPVTSGRYKKGKYKISNSLTHVRVPSYGSGPMKSLPGLIEDSSPARSRIRKRFGHYPASGLLYCLSFSYSSSEIDPGRKFLP